MSALSERIGDDHRVWSIESTDDRVPGIGCACGEAPERMSWSEYAEHVAEVTEAAVAAAIRADRDVAGNHGASDDTLVAYEFCALIAEGKQS